MMQLGGNFAETPNGLLKFVLYESVPRPLGPVHDPVTPCQCGALTHAFPCQIEEGDSMDQCLHKRKPL